MSKNTQAALFVVALMVAAALAAAPSWVSVIVAE